VLPPRRALVATPPRAHYVHTTTAASAVRLRARVSSFQPVTGIFLPRRFPIAVHCSVARRSESVCHRSSLLPRARRARFDPIFEFLFPSTGRSGLATWKRITKKKILNNTPTRE